MEIFKKEKISISNLIFFDPIAHEMTKNIDQKLTFLKNINFKTD